MRSLRRLLAASAMAVALALLAETAPGAGASSASAIAPAATPAAESTLVCTPAEPTAITAPAGSAWRVVGETVIDPTIWSGHLVAQAVVRDGEIEYAAYYDSDLQLAVARRASPDHDWAVERIPGVDATVGWDSHNAVTLGVDERGGLHIAANMHGDPMRYWYTPTPTDLSTVQRVPVLVDAATERSVTYPVFVTRTDGQLSLSFRDGASGAGDVRLYAFDAARRAWRDQIGGALFDGQGVRNPYVQLTMEQNADGWFEAVWMWRRTPDVATNARLSYARSRDLVHWESAAGVPLALPFTFESADAVVDDFPERSGALNGSVAIAHSAGGVPVLGYFRLDASGDHQVFAATPVGDGWLVRPLTRWTGSVPVEGTGTLGVDLRVRGVHPAGPNLLRLDFVCGGATSRMGSILFDDTSLEVLGEGRPPETGLPDSALTPLPGSGAALVVRSAQAIDAEGGLAIVWQSQGTNYDRPFPSVSDPMPLRALELAPATAPGAPRALELIESALGVEVHWQPPADDGGRPVASFAVERAIDGGEWVRVEPSGDALVIGADELEGAIALDVRVTARNAIGAGPAAQASTIVAELVVDEPAIVETQDPPAQDDGDADVWSFFALGAVVLLAVVGIRRAAHRARRDPLSER